ncbi:myb-related transcription factor, partner of profilin-like [Takifugu flavidus]|uniref:myb-related transcription factor, partner of profilin-like n=1 Tax=Takifugu flavidus TaxID=433684 RepID=UPI0025444B10|nr:myb-related transcription factor, partner of profilin-like [Takifugu flavidus]
MPKAKKKSDGAQQKIVLLTRRKSLLFSSVSAGYTGTNKKEIWAAITSAVDAVSGEGRSVAEVKKKWFDLKCETKKNIAKFRRETQQTGGGTSHIKSLSEFDQRLRAIIGETALSGVPSAECLDTDLGPEATLSPPPCASSAPEDSEVPQSQPVEGQTDPSCSNTRPRSLASPRLISDAVLNNQQRMANTLDKIASTLMTIANTLKEINDNVKK